MKLFFLMIFSMTACGKSSQILDLKLQNNAEKVTTETPGGSENEAPTDTALNLGSLFRNGQVSRWDLDTIQFRIEGFTVGLQSLLDSETPLLTWERPPEADFLEVIRCPADISFEGTSIDTFTQALHHPSCLVTSQLTGPPPLWDGATPNGSYRWLARACVHPDRLKDRDQLDTRYCSRLVATSSVLTDYKNGRTEKERNYTKKSQSIRSLMYQTLSVLQAKGQAFVAAIDKCEKDNHARALAKKKRDAIITIFAGVTETAFEVWTVKRALAGQNRTLVQHYTRPKTKQQWMDLFQLAGSPGGIMTSSLYMDLFQSSEDIPRSCASSMALEKDIQILTQNIAFLDMSYQIFNGLAQESSMLADIGEGTTSDVEKTLLPMEELLSKDASLEAFSQALFQE